MKAGLDLDLVRDPGNSRFRAIVRLRVGHRRLFARGTTWDLVSSYAMDRDRPPGCVCSVAWSGCTEDTVRK